MNKPTSDQPPAVEPAQRCNCCGYLVTDSEHKGCLRAAKQEPAQAVPVGYCLMPREPTQWMREQIACGIESNSVADVWGRLIRAVDIENKHRAKEPAQAVPVGYCLMPREPTQWMRAQIACGIESNSVADVWGRLIRAVDIENKHRAKEPAQAVPVAWLRPDKCHVDFHKHPGYLPLYTVPPAIDETRHKLILVCEYLETVGLMFVSPRVISSQIRAILEAGNEN